MHVLIYFTVSFGYLLRLMTRDYYIGNLGTTIPKATDLRNAINFTLSGYNDYDGGMFILKTNYQLVPNRKNHILNFVPYNPYSLEEDNLFYIAIDAKSGFNRIINKKRCVEWMQKENNFKMRPCADVDEQLFDLVDVGA